MDPRVRNRLILRWGVLVTLLLCIFWSGWYMVKGSMPFATHLLWEGGPKIRILRIWDVVQAPLYAAVLVPWKMSERYQAATGAEGISAGIIFLLPFGMMVGSMMPIFDWSCVFIWMSIGALVAQLSYFPPTPQRFSLGKKLVAVLFYVAAGGLTVGIVTGVVSGLVFWMYTSIGTFLGIAIPKALRAVFLPWLTGKDL